MAKEVRRIDVTNMPEVLKLAEEVQASGEACVLRRDSEDIAVVMPARARRRTPRGGVMTKDDPLFGLIGIGKSGIPGGISGKKHEYLLDAYRRHLD